MAYVNAGIEYFRELLLLYEGGTHYFAAWGLCLLLLAVCGGRKGRAVFFYPTLILLLTVLNPFFIGMLFADGTESLSGFQPYLWMLPVLIVIPAGAGALASKLPYRILQVLPFAAVIAFALLCGVPRPSAYKALTFPENYHKADTELLTICSYLEVHKTKNGYSAAFESAAMQDECAEYTARIRTSDLFRTEEDLTDASKLKTALAEDAPDFIVCAKAGKLPETLDAVGWKAVAHTEHYYLYREK